MKRNRWTRPGILLGMGLSLLLGGIGWAVATGVAIPYPDPTPAMQAYEDRHMMITDVLMGAGALLVLVALVWFVVAFARRKTGVAPD